MGGREMTDMLDQTAIATRADRAQISIPWADKVVAWSAAAGAIAALGGLYVGWCAYQEYVRTNVIALNSRYEEQDGQLNDKIIERPILAEIYTSRPGVVGNELIEARDQLDKISADGQEVGAKDANHYFEDVVTFSCESWLSSSDIRTEGLVRAYFFAEEHLYLINGTFDNRSVVLASGKGLIDEYDYIVEVGTHPLFLSALFEGTRWGYLSDEFAMWARKRIMSDEENGKYLEKVFPELYDEDKWRWIAGLKHGSEACRLDANEAAKSDQ
jgi:hypothetical protein